MNKYAARKNLIKQMQRIRAAMENADGVKWYELKDELDLIKRKLDVLNIRTDKSEACNI